MKKLDVKSWVWFAGVVLTVLALPGCQRRARRDAMLAHINPGDQPDKVLYEKATNEINHGRYDVGRLTLQTLINTYPDSEFLAKAKLAIADSFYSEGGVSGFTQAEAEYKDFITFFPTAPEAPEAQYRVGMSHYRLMAKADRDRTEAKLAEAEFKEFLLKYPNSPMMPRVKGRLREVQEVLGQSEYMIASFYYMRHSYPAARSRFQEIVEHYPNFSHVDDAMWFTGQSLEKLRKPKDATPYYAGILAEHPFSPHAVEAKQRLVAMHQPIPRPTKAILARARADAAQRRVSRDPLSKLSMIMSGAPDTSTTRHGPVHLGPQPTPIEAAKTAAPAPTVGTATIVAQPVSDATLSTGTPVDTKSTDPSATTKTSAEPTDKAAAPANNPAASTSPNPDNPVPVKKKKRGGLLRKLNPF